MGVEFFDTYFHQLTELLFGFGLIKEGDDVIIDSAPVEASQNFARSNSGIQINEERLKFFFDTVDFRPVVKLIAPPSNHGRKRTYSDELILKFIVFKKLCGFMSRSQALTHLKKHPSAAKIVGFSAGDILSTSTISNYLKRMPPISWLMRVMVDAITEFFESEADYDDQDPLSFSFQFNEFSKLSLLKDLINSESLRYDSQDKLPIIRLSKNTLISFPEILKKYNPQLPNIN